jgi:hypothetical protein
MGRKYAIDAVTGLSVLIFNKCDNVYYFHPISFPVTTGIIWKQAYVTCFLTGMTMYATFDAYKNNSLLPCDPMKHEVYLSSIYRFSSYFIENTAPLLRKPAS